MATGTHDEGGYKSPPASVDPDPIPWGPFSKRKPPIDDYHTCPYCNGYGFVGIVNEKRPPIKKKDVVEDGS